MHKLLVNSLLGLALTAGTFSFAPVASAESLQLELGQGGPKLRLRKDCDPSQEDCRLPRSSGAYNNDDNDDFDRDNSPRNRRSVRMCTDDNALDKAERLGLRRARIETSGRKMVEVRGRQRDGERVTLAFGRAPNCPIIN